MTSRIYRLLLIVALLSGLLALNFAAPPRAQATAYSCDEAGLDAAIAAGSGPHTFNCAGPTTVTITGTKTIAASVILDGGGLLTISGGGSPAGHRVFAVDSGVTLDLRNITVANGYVFGQTNPGSGIYNDGGTVILTNSTLSKNYGSGDTPSGYAQGGGIYNNGSIVTITNSTLSNNFTSYAFGGGIYNNGGTVTITNTTLSGNYTYSHGGGIFNNGGMATLTNSTLSGNTGRYGEGGGVYNSGTVTLTNSTLSGNSSRFGSGVYNSSLGTVTIINSTFSGNQASGAGGGIFNETDGTVTVSNSIVANSSSGNCSGTIADGSNNIDDEAAGTCGFGGLPAGTSPLLGPLASNGGPTQTHALQAGSPAIDAGNPTICAAALPDGADGVDQRGMTRPQDGNGDCVAVCDIGAYELLASNDTDGDGLGDACGSVPVNEASEAPRCKVGITFDSNPPHEAPNPERWGLPQVSGELRFFTFFGYDTPYFQPEGWLEGTLPVVAGQPTRGEIDVACGRHVRAWLFDTSGNLIGMVPSQYEGGDGALVPELEDYGSGDPNSPYEVPVYNGRYAEIIPAYGMPGDLNAIMAKLNGCEIMQQNQGDRIEWGCYDGAQYYPLGWAWVSGDGSTNCSIPDEKEKRPHLLTLEEFCAFAESR